MALTRIKPDIEGEITFDENKSGRLAESVSGGQFAVYLGCDNILNKPIIIAEGLDMGQDVNFDDLDVKYTRYLNRFRNNGYDLVYLNYHDGRASIQENAQVLKRVINEMRNRIPAADSIIVVGESMSGLVARWALREMENAGQQHKVKLFVAFDTPHQGANVPPGLIALRNSLASLTGWATPLANLFSAEVRAINTPAAKQMLLYWNGVLPHPDFGSFQQALTSLGNGGYPSLSKNIALINGRLDGGRQVNYTGGTLNPGDRILEFRLRAIVAGVNASAWTNNLGASTKLYQSISTGIFNGFSTSTLNSTLPFNRDRLPGGFISYGSDHDTWVFRMGTRTRFSFVPIYSAIDYKGPLNNDGNFTFSVNGNIINSLNQVINPALTPFKAIYGSSSQNTSHAIPRDLQGSWNTLAFRELGLAEGSALASCLTLSPPPAVQKAVKPYRGIWSYSTLPAGACKLIIKSKSINNVITLFIGDNNYSYEQFIEITGPNGYFARRDPSQGRADWSYGSLENGTYNIIAVRQLHGGGGRVSTSTPFNLSSCSGSRIAIGECPTDDESGDLIGILSDTNEPCYATKVNGVWIAVLEDGGFVSRERLVANGLTQEGANCYAAFDPQGSAPASACSDLGSITYQRWDGIGGETMEDLYNGTNYFQNNPTITQNVNLFEGPSNIADSYGSRIRGYVCPPVSGLYTFWIAADNQADLWISSNDNPDNAQMIAYQDSWAPSREWSWYPNQRSFPITLQANQKYYIEARMKEGDGGDNIAVGWQLPNGSLERPIPGNRLSPFSSDPNTPACDYNVSASVSNSNPNAGQSIQLYYNCNGSDCNGVSYSWSGNGVSGSANGQLVSSPSTGTYTVTATKNGCSKTSSVYVAVNSNNNNQSCIVNRVRLQFRASGDCCMERLVGAKIQGSNNGGTSWADLYTFNQNGNGSMTFYDFSNNTAYSSVRFVAGASGWGELNELEFYNGNTKLSGSPFGSAGNNSNDNFDKAFDGNTSTQWHGPTVGSINYAGLNNISGCSSSPQCDYNVSASASNTNPSGGQSVQLSYNCSGQDCGGLTYSWSGNGISGNSQVMSVTVPGSAGSYYYTVTASKSGCSKTGTVQINVGGSSSGVNCNSVVGHMNAGCAAINGWVYDQSQPNTVINVDIYEGNTLIQGNVPANIFGQDLLDANIGNGVHGFQIETPSFLRNGQNRSIRVLASGCSYELYNSPKVINCSPNARIGSAEMYLPLVGREEEIVPDLIVSPNPNNGTFKINFMLEATKTAVLSVVDVQGKVHYKRSYMGKAKYSEKITLPSHLSGSFTIVLTEDKKQIAKKIIVVN